VAAVRLLTIPNSLRVSMTAVKPVTQAWLDLERQTPLTRIRQAASGAGKSGLTHRSDRLQP